MIARIAESVLALPPERLPPLEMANVIGSHDLDHFKINGVRFFEEIAQRLRISPDARVLDIGCGCGRMAIPFTQYLINGRYEGCDTWAEGVDWCNRNLGSWRSNFVAVPTLNNYYFDDFDPNVFNDYKLDWIGTGTIDHAFAISTFTHLTRRDIESYLKETGRVLRKGGLAYYTFFLLDRYVWNYVAQTGFHAGLKESEPGCYYAYQGQDFFAGYTMATLQEMFAAAGLEIVSYELGEWAWKPGSRNYQDTFILEKV
jgi:cyclopropane fatty-acyl-phospholipid synthase-like methyltransferase